MLKKHRSSPPNAGFTLIELLVYMAIFAGFLTIMSGFFISTLETQADATSTASLDADSWYLMSRLQHDLYQANAIVTPGTNGETSSTLTLDFVDYQLSYLLLNGQITLSRDSQNYTLNSQGVTTTNLSFTRLGNDDGATSINVTANLNSPDGSQNKALNFGVGLRQ
jgi:prepilin-type N-terminal cleavage/methylation domain-containing protein